MTPDTQVSQLTYKSVGDPQRRVLQFLNEQLRQGAGFSVGDEFPSVFGEFPGGDSLYIERQGKIAAHTAVLARDFRLSLGGEWRLKVGLIGSVATAPAFRGQGLASTLIQESIATVKKRGCALAVLWSDNPDFYTPFGFHRAGRESDFKFSAAEMPSAEGTAMEFDSVRHSQGVWRLYQKHDVKVDRSLEEQKKLCRIPKCRIFVTEGGGKVTSYLAIQKGADFENYIHEWGGEGPELARNIAWVQKNVYPGHPLTLISPAHYEMSAVRRIAVETWQGVVGLMKIVDRGAVMAVYRDFLRSRGIEHSWDAAHETFRSGGKSTVLSGEKDYLNLIFGGEAPLTAESLPSLPFFLWGFDSI